MNEEEASSSTKKDIENRNINNNAQNMDAALNAASKTGIPVVKAANIVNKVTGGAVTKIASKVVTPAMQQMQGGKQLQAISNKISGNKNESTKETEDKSKPEGQDKKETDTKTDDKEKIKELEDEDKKSKENIASKKVASKKTMVKLKIIGIALAVFAGIFGLALLITMATAPFSGGGFATFWSGIKSTFSSSTDDEYVEKCHQFWDTDELGEIICTKTKPFFKRFDSLKKKYEAKGINVPDSLILTTVFFEFGPSDIKQCEGSFGDECTFGIDESNDNFYQDLADQNGKTITDSAATARSYADLINKEKDTLRILFRELTENEFYCDIHTTQCLLQPVYETRTTYTEVDLPPSTPSNKSKIVGYCTCINGRTGAKARYSCNSNQLSSPSACYSYCSGIGMDGDSATCASSNQNGESTGLLIPNYTKVLIGYNEVPGSCVTNTEEQDTFISIKWHVGRGMFDNVFERTFAKFTEAAQYCKKFESPKKNVINEATNTYYTTETTTTLKLKEKISYSNYKEFLVYTDFFDLRDNLAYRFTEKAYQLGLDSSLELTEEQKIEVREIIYLEIFKQFMEMDGKDFFLDMSMDINFEVEDLIGLGYGYLFSDEDDSYASLYGDPNDLGSDVPIVGQTSITGEVGETGELGAIASQSIASLLEKAGSSIEELNQKIYAAIKKAGVGTKAGILAGVEALIKGLAEYDIVIPYQFGGKSNNFGVKGSWGADLSSPKWADRLGRYEYTNGIDCSGFIVWAYKQAGIQIGGGTSSIYKYGTQYESINMAEPGDIVNKPNGHVVLVVDRVDTDGDGKADSYYVAEAKGKNYGVLYTTRSFASLQKGGYKAINMDKAIENKKIDVSELPEELQ